MVHPVPVTDLKGDVKSVTTSQVHTLVRTQDDDLYIFGSNEQLFEPDTHFTLGINNTSVALFPVLVAKNVSSVSSIRGYHSMYQIGNRTFGFGYNFQGQLGTNTATHQTPREIPTLYSVNFTQPLNVSKIVCSSMATLFLTTEGQVYSLGSGSAVGLDQIAFPQPILTTTFVIEGVTDIEAGQHHVLAQTTTGDLITWGDDGRGQLGRQGDGNLLPALVANFTGVTLMSAYDHSLVVSNGSLFSFGENSNGQLCLGHIIDQNAPIRVEGLSSVQSIAAGVQFSLVLLANKTIFTCGIGLYGQLGLGDTLDRWLPTRIPGVSAAVAVAAGLRQAFFIVECNATHAGPNCEYPVCFGYSAQTSEACSSQGQCVAPNQCVCYSPSFGDRCQYSEYHWKGFSGSWSIPSSWYIKKGQNLYDSVSVPQTSGDSIFFDTKGGDYTVTVDVTQIEASSIIIGSVDNNVASSSRINVDFNSVNLVIRDNFIIGSNAICGISNSNVRATSTTIMNDIVISNTRFEGDTLILRNQTTLTRSNFFVKNTIILGSIAADTASFTNGIIQLNGILSFQGTYSLQDSVLRTYQSPTLLLTVIRGVTSRFENYGQVNISHTDIQIPIRNFGVVQFKTESINIGDVYVQYPNSRTTFMNGSSVALGKALNVTEGDFEVFGGTMHVTSFMFASDGIFRLSGDFNIQGNATFLSRSTLFANLSQTTGKKLFVSGDLMFGGFLLLNLDDDYPNPVIGDQMALAKASTIRIVNPMIYMMGAPYKNAEFVVTKGSLDLVVVFSLGSVSNPGYECHYLGNQKILELNLFRQQSKVMLTLTAPIRENWIGFGFDGNSTLYSLSKSTQMQQVDLNGQKVSPATWLHSKSSPSNTIFAIGPLYQSVSILIPLNTLNSQKNVYYFEVSNLTALGLRRENMTFQEIWPFDILKDAKIDCTNFLQPTRVEPYSYVALALVLALYSILFVLCIVFYRYNPLKTRGISPLLTLAFLAIQLLLEIRNYFEIPSFQGSLCFFYTFCIYPLQQICFIVILIYFLRYFSIININEKKNLIHSKQKIGNVQTVDKMEVLKIRLLKIITSTPLTIIVLICSYFFIVGIFCIVLAADRFICRFSTLLALKTLHNVQLLVLYALTLLVLVGDIIANARLIFKNCKVWDYIFYRDPHYFRTQIVLFLPFMVASMTIEIWSLFATIDYIGVITNHYSIIIMNTVIFAILLCIDVIYPLLCTFYELLRNCSVSRKKQDSELSKLLQNTDSPEFLLFSRFLEMEFAIENLSCWLDIQSFKKSGDETSMRAIFETYLNGAASPMEINIRSDLSKQVLRRMEQEGVTNRLTVFADIEEACILNLCDNYSRFIVHDHAYRKRRASQKLARELIEN